MVLALVHSWLARTVPGVFWSTAPIQHRMPYSNSAKPCTRNRACLDVYSALLCPPWSAWFAATVFVTQLAQPVALRGLSKTKAP